MIDNLLIGTLGALIGVFFGHRLAITLYRERSRSLETALYNEFKIIRDDFKIWFPTLVDEHDTPLMETYSGPPPLDLRLIQSIVVELASTDRLINPDQRILLSRMERGIENIRRKDLDRDIHIKRWLESDGKVDKLERHNISQEITFSTAQMLLDVSQAIYFLNRAVSERRNFSFGEEPSILRVFYHTCTICEMEFIEDKWNSLIKRLNVE